MKLSCRVIGEKEWQTEVNGKGWSLGELGRSWKRKRIVKCEYRLVRC
jgi:hypothetical protein